MCSKRISQRSDSSKEALIQRLLVSLKKSVYQKVDQELEGAVDQSLNISALVTRASKIGK